jgi:hypothetical protein
MAKQEAEKLVVQGHKLFESHTGHSKHLCDLVAKRKMAEVARLSRGARYVCHICGRAAAKASNLCEPVEI